MKIFSIFFWVEFWKFKISLYLCTAIPKGLAQYEAGAIAQLVEQRTENPCVPGSIPGGTTEKAIYESRSLFCFGLVGLIGRVVWRAKRQMA